MKQAYLLLLCLIAYSCSSTDSNLYEINPEEFTVNKITLSDIADDIKYIPLDNSTAIGLIYTYKITESSIYLSVKDIGILEFDHEGKLLRKIGSHGRGPGEYYYYMHFDFDPNAKSVYVLENNIIKVYTGNGQFQRNITLKEYGGRIFDDINFFNGKLLITENIYMGQAKYSWLILDTVGMLIKSKHNPIPIFNSNLPSAGGTYKFDGKIVCWELYNDTVYSILPDLSYGISFIFSPGEYRWPKSTVQISQSNSFVSFLNNHMQILRMFETNNFLVLVYSLRGNWIAVIDKLKSKTFLCGVESFGGTLGSKQVGGILNDLDGGTLFQPENYFVEDSQEYMVGLQYPYQIKVHVASTDFKNLIPEYPEKKKELEKLANSLKETDNPVLVLVRIKK